MTNTAGTWRWLTGAGIAGILLCGGAVSARLQAQAQATPPILIQSLAGRDTFERYCSACHGKSGHGDGSVASSLKTRPPDLTTLSKKNGGTFPRERVMASIVNVSRPITAHGTGEMPVWGQIFPALDPNTDRVTVRLEQVVDYVAALQEPASPSVDTGRELFLTYCASCHGANARGNGPMADQLRHEVPDLTTLTSRNGGVFPGARLHDIIDGRGIASHGNRAMPIWGIAFATTRGGYSPEVITSRIEALVKYLESIQTRATD